MIDSSSSASSAPTPASAAPTAGFDASPIIVGALGGSGTRVIGQILIDSGVHLGHNLNVANDSLTASILFNRPEWIAASSRADRLAVFTQVQRFLLGRQGPSDRLAPARAAVGLDHPGLRHRCEYVLGTVRERGPASAARAWGFKEPNTHMFIDELHQLFAGLRYIYVMRHPLDMAFSSNIQQLQNWHERYGLRVPTDEDEIATAQLDLWLEASRRAIETGTKLLGDRFLAVDYEALVRNPIPDVDALLRFTGYEAPDERLKMIASSVGTPRSVGRYKNHDLSQFGDDRLQAITEFGFAV